MKAKIIKIIIRHLTYLIRNGTISNRLLPNSRHTNQSTTTNRKNLSNRNKAIYGKKHIYDNPQKYRKI